VLSGSTCKYRLNERSEVWDWPSRSIKQAQEEERGVSGKQSRALLQDAQQKSWTWSTWHRERIAIKKEGPRMELRSRNWITLTQIILSFHFLFSLYKLLRLFLFISLCHNTHTNKTNIYIHSIYMYLILTFNCAHPQGGISLCCSPKLRAIYAPCKKDMEVHFPKPHLPCMGHLIPHFI
jgi:hypothetical protein